jgi:hypothetical protein
MVTNKNLKHTVSKKLAKHNSKSCYINFKNVSLPGIPESPEPCLTHPLPQQPQVNPPVKPVSHIWLTIGRASTMTEMVPTARG